MTGLVSLEMFLSIQETLGGSTAKYLLIANDRSPSVLFISQMAKGPATQPPTLLHPIAGIPSAPSLLQSVQALFIQPSCFVPHHILHEVTFHFQTDDHFYGCDYKPLGEKL